MSNSLLICRHITPLSLSLQLQIVIYTFEIMFLIRNVSELSRLLMVPVLRFMFFHFNLSTNERNIISHKTLLKHFKTLRHVSILSDHHQGALFLAKVTLQYSQFNSYLQTRCCGSISCCVVEQWLGVRRTTHT